MSDIKYYVGEMIAGLNTWLKSENYNYIECNHVPEVLFVKNHLVNVFWRTLYRLSPVNLRSMKRKDGDFFPLTPQSLVALLKAYDIQGRQEICGLLYSRVISLKSPKTKKFALRQGIRIAVNLYENDSDDPTPLNTVWFGQYLLDEQLDVIGETENKELLLSISDYLIEELGYIDYGESGVYFYYGPTLKKEIYNASALISSFLLCVGNKYNVQRYKELGKRGVLYIIRKQNEDGSWFYAGYPERKTIDNFHQSYILQALITAKQFMPLEVAVSIEKGVDYYRKYLFRYCGDRVIPIRFDKRFIPCNTWLIQKVDGRDVAEALVLFSKYIYDKEMVAGLVNYLYGSFYDKKRGCLISEIFIYGKNRIPYMEFQAWFLYALTNVHKYYKE